MTFYRPNQIAKMLQNKVLFILQHQQLEIYLHFFNA